MSQAGPLNVTGEGPPPLTEVTFITNSGSAVTNSGDIYLVGGTADVTTTGSGNTVTILVTASSFSWQAVTSVSPANPIQIAVSNGYICNGTNMVTFILPLAPNLGDEFTIISNTSRFEITENSSQQICIGTAASTAGSGNATSNGTGDEYTFVYVGGNIFRGFAGQGTLTLN